MSHLTLRKVDGKWKIYNKKIKDFVGKPMDDREEAEKVRLARDVKEDKKE